MQGVDQQFKRNRKRTLAGLSALAAAAGLFALQPIHAQNQAADKDKKTKDMAKDVATQPAEDVGAKKKEIPPELKAIQKKPYSLKGISNCSQISDEIAKMDKALGDDLDVKKDKSKEQKRKDTAGRVGGSVVGGLIPFRGLVREVSGAASRQRKYNDAVYAGVVRRSFLKGIGHERGCKYPARPASVK